MSVQTKVSAAEFQNNFGRYADAARQEPITITRYGRDELVVLSAAEYARMRASYRRLIVLDEIDPNEAAELFEALARSEEPPETAELDYLMSDDDSAKS